MHHSDRGSQYSYGAYQALLAAYGIRCRMTRKGDGLDHAVVEGFCGRLKSERTALCHNATRQEARNDVIDDIEICYHRTRLHSSLGDVSPHDFARVANVAELSVRFSFTTSDGFYPNLRSPRGRRRGSIPSQE
jgi:transposase InsO family protein